MGGLPVSSLSAAVSVVSRECSLSTTSICGSGDVDELPAGDVGGGERGTQRIGMFQEASLHARVELQLQASHRSSSRTP